LFRPPDYAGGVPFGSYAASRSGLPKQVYSNRWVKLEMVEFVKRLLLHRASLARSRSFARHIHHVNFGIALALAGEKVGGWPHPKME
jgi:hypothetical protein